MGITAPFLKLIIKENNHKPLEGKLMVIGKQTIGVSKDELRKIFESHNLSFDNLSKIKNFDNQTLHGKRYKSKKFFHDHDVFKNISPNLRYNSLDRSKYEGAKIVQDMNFPLNKKLNNKFDVIIDGGCMDNLFNPINFITNVSKMLKPGGRFMCANHFFQAPGAFLTFNPEWYYGFFAVNNYKDVKVYVALAKKNSKNKSRYNYKSELYEYKPYFKRNKNYDYFDAVKNMNTIANVLVVAEKAKNSTNDKYPCQLQYMDNKEINWAKKYFDYKKSKRKLFNIRNNYNKKIFNSDHYNLLDNNY